MVSNEKICYHKNVLLKNLKKVTNEMTILKLQKHFTSHFQDTKRIYYIKRSRQK